MFEVLQQYIGEALTAIVTAFVVWYPNRKKTELDNGKMLVDLYKDNVADIRKMYEEREEYLKKDFDQKFSDMKAAFEGRISKVEGLVNEWRAKYFKLKADFDKYKKDHP